MDGDKIGGGPLASTQMGGDCWLMKERLSSQFTGQTSRMPTALSDQLELALNGMRNGAYPRSVSTASLSGRSDIELCS